MSEEKPNTDAPASESPAAAASPAQAPKNRKDRRVQRVFLGAFLLAAVVVVYLQMRSPGLEGWNEDFSAALEQAKREDRPILAYFVRSPSDDLVRRMMNTTLDKNKAVIEETGLIRVMVRTSVGSDLAKKYSLTALPTMAVLSPDGAKCPTLNDYAGQFIGQVDFRVVFLEPSFEGWTSNQQTGFDLDDVLEKAKSAHRPVLALFVHTTTSRDTRKFAFTTLAAKEVQDALEEDRFVKVLIRAHSEQHPLAKRCGVPSLPSLVIVTPAGRHRLLEGYAATKELLAFLALPGDLPR